MDLYLYQPLTGVQSNISFVAHAFCIYRDKDRYSNVIKMCKWVLCRGNGIMEVSQTHSHVDAEEVSSARSYVHIYSYICGWRSHFWHGHSAAHTFTLFSILLTHSCCVARELVMNWMTMMFWSFACRALFICTSGWWLVVGGDFNILICCYIIHTVHLRISGVNCLFFIINQSNTDNSSIAC